MPGDWFSTNNVTQRLSDTAKPEISSQNKAVTPFEFDSLDSKSQSIHNYFVPGWRGESLISKDVKIFKQVLDKLHRDAKSKFYHEVELSRRLKVLIYNEFLSYSDFKALNFTELDHYSKFWSELRSESSKYRIEIDQFIDILSFRIAVVYLLKTRFILTLQEKMRMPFDLKTILYPNAYLTKVFQTASSTELRTKAFEQNVFNWYRPGEDLKNELLSFKEVCPNLKITEIIKNISLKSESILGLKTDYSHAISHKSFGLFINDLLINFPIWLDTLGDRHNRIFPSRNSKLDIISTKFSGDNLESLALSHWLAQHKNRSLKWEQILCPDFKNNDFQSGIYLKVVQELQFLTFLTEIAGLQGEEPKSFLSETINSHLLNRKDSGDLQKSLLLNESELINSTYDRIVLNLSKFPKNNPQHFLFNKILNEKKHMKENGYLYVITSKKLFVPSQKNKVDNLLKELKIEGRIDLDDVTGKGEVGSYIYIFSNISYRPSLQLNKHTCLSFRFHGQLESFHDFSHITYLNQNFYQSHPADIPPLHQKTNQSFRLEFFQDAIVSGQLIHSSSKDISKVTHPHFFKKLMGICNPLDYFFELQNVDFEEGQEEEDSLFNFSHSFKRDKAQYTFIVDQRSKELVRLEVIPTSTLEAKSYEYGHTLCSYFYAYPKWPGMDIQSIKEYFGSNIGQQIINLTFSNEMRKIKGNLSKILLPKYFAKSTALPNHINAGLKFLSISADELLAMHPSEIARSYQDIKGILPGLVQTYPANTLTLLANFKRSVLTALEKTGCLNKTASINFNNPILKTPLLLSKTYAIYPDNKDVYIDFNSEALELIHHPVTKIKKVSEQKGDYTGHGLKIFVNDEEAILTMYSDEYMINFLEFLIGNISGVPLSKMLQGIQVPRLDDLKSIVGSYNSLNRFLTELNSELPKEYNQLLNSTILNS